MSPLPFRQVHLDFHTSPHIPGVGEEFDADEFARTLAEAHVNSVTLFAKCHHGWSYYPTRVGKVHPHLKPGLDLLGEQIEACQRRGIRTPVYTTVVWDELAADEHQDWWQIQRDGRVAGRAPLSGRPVGWRWLCLSSPQVDYVAEQTEEFCRLYPVDGVFFDIMFQTFPGCVCSRCLRRMQERGIDPANDDALLAHSIELAHLAMQRLSGVVRAVRPEATIFFNARQRQALDPAQGMPGERDYYTHFELESLPSGHWGYNHYPLNVRYFQTLGKPILGMTGRFHKSWADFGGVKNRAALEYECHRILATGAACSIGDQLPPRGRLDRASYRLIGEVYAAVEAKEPWCVDAEPQAEIGVLLPAGPPDDAEFGRFSLLGVDKASLEGAMRVLLELHHQFQIIDRDADLSRYRAIIAPDSVPPEPGLVERLRAYLAGGGALIASHEALLDRGEGRFALDELGVEYRGPAPFSPDYLRVKSPSLADGPAGPLPETDLVLYERGSDVRARPGTEVLASVVNPYFNRAWDHFCSHQHTPPAVESEQVAASRRGTVVYFHSPLFRAYRLHAYRPYKQAVGNALAALLGTPLVQAAVPSSAEVTLLRQPAASGRPERLVCHLLSYVPERRGATLDVVEDVVPLFDVAVQMRTANRPGRVYLAPQGEDLPFQYHRGVVSLRVPRLDGHQMVVIEGG